MIRRILLVVLSFWLAACSAHDEHYYRQHPTALQSALKKCDEQASKEQNCTQLQEMAVRMNDLALQLREDPQAYGQKILALQEKIAGQEADLQSNVSQPELKTLIAENKQQLSERLAVVKWLESPES